ncbi:hypothetical protein VCHENC01_2459 [Vibrio harveyi]|jgi:hypothetical protein|nr:hypothetical protein VCHENC01_2459 [Vibrio harveyi]
MLCTSKQLAMMMAMMFWDEIKLMRDGCKVPGKQQRNTE